jgi:hypothetical protein
MLRDTREKGGQRTTPYDLLPWAAQAEDEARLVLASAGLLVWMDAKEAAAYLNYPKATFDTLAAKEEIPRHKRGAGHR